MEKKQEYIRLLSRIRALISGSDIIADMANLSALVHQTFGFWWTGFYRVKDGELVLGPFQGPVACTRIPFGRGVCGSAWKAQETIIVPDVEKFPGHIACSAESRSEIVVPVWQRGRIIAVLDIDSKETDCFDSIDREYLEQVCAELSCSIDADLREYVRNVIIPRYDSFDKGHGRDHAETVMAQALLLAARYDVNPDMIYAAAACHDLGLREGRDTHNIVSARIIRADENLRRWFTPEEIDIIADAAEDHRASLGHEPRTIYGKIVAEADRLIEPESVVRRAILFGLSKHPEFSREEQWQRVREHLKEKYAEGGYLKLWIPESPNAERLVELRSLIDDATRLREMFDTIIDHYV